jgi:hypothetical protein
MNKHNMPSMEKAEPKVSLVISSGSRRRFPNQRQKTAPAARYGPWR